jgi:NAD-dependent dihydropyrimidine dehydrogenase PreA subunit
MKRMRKVIEIDENTCNGCGQCILACAEGALKLVDGKARLVGDILCDGLGACIGDCPTGALRIVEREAEDFSEEALEKHIGKKSHGPSVHEGPATLPCGCPSSSVMTFALKDEPKGIEGRHCAEMTSQLGHWPVKLQLLSPQAPFLKGSDMLLMADCCGVAGPNLHEKLFKGRTVAIACPKLDDIEKHIQRLAEILVHATPRTLTVVHMEVPCCTGLVHAALEALRRAGVDIPLKHIVMSRRGEITAEEEIGVSKHAREHV